MSSGYISIGDAIYRKGKKAIGIWKSGEKNTNNFSAFIRGFCNENIAMSPHTTSKVPVMSPEFVISF